MNLPSAIISSPPREVPLSTRIAILLGGPLARPGWVFFGFGILFVFVFTGKADLTSWYLFQGKTETTQGIVTAVEKTKAMEGGDLDEKKTPIYAYSYHFNYNQTGHQGLNYHTGIAKQNGTNVMEQSTVAVEFLESNPDISRIQLQINPDYIQNMRRNVFGPEAAIPLIFPLAGLVCILVDLMRGRKNLSLLVSGELTHAKPADQKPDQTPAETNAFIQMVAKLTGKKPVRTQSNRIALYKVWFEFTDLHGELQKAFTKTINPGIIEGTGLEPLFYNRQSPSHIVLLRELPRGNATLDERGQVSACGIFAMLKVLWPPLLGLAFIVASWLIYHHAG